MVRVGMDFQAVDAGSEEIHASLEEIEKDLFSVCMKKL